ncbi:MAG: hypothetical protein WCX61_04355 [Candidatus Peribacteraceae bacterium]|jgi:hypothetical protein
MKPLDATKVDRDAIMNVMQGFLVPGLEQECRAKVNDVLDAMESGGEALKSMIDSIREGLDGLFQIKDWDSQSAALHRFTQKLVELCAQAQTEAMRSVAEMN